MYSSQNMIWLVVSKDKLTITSLFSNSTAVGKAVNDESILVRMIQALAVPVIGNACYVFMHGLNHVQVQFSLVKFFLRPYNHLSYMVFCLPGCRYMVWKNYTRL